MQTTLAGNVSATEGRAAGRRCLLSAVAACVPQCECRYQSWERYGLLLELPLSPGGSCNALGSDEHGYGMRPPLRLITRPGALALLTPMPAPPPLRVQVATLCVERGHMLALLWGALRHVLHAVLADRDTARTTATTARRMAAQAAQVTSVVCCVLCMKRSQLAAARSLRGHGQAPGCGPARLKTHCPSYALRTHGKLCFLVALAPQDKADALARIESEKADMDRMNELLNRRLLGAKMEAEHVRTRHQDVRLGPGGGEGEKGVGDYG